MVRYNSGRVRKFDQTGITSDRYQFLGLEQAEPDLGDPIVGVSSVIANPAPPGDQYVLAAVDGQVGKRYWLKSTNLVGIGSTGTQGTAGPPGSQGVQGSLSNFQGTQGRQGTQGNQGLQGNQGIQGVQGFLSNFQGTQGNQGSQGTQGNQGLQGTQGNQGLQGTSGNQGSQGLQGNQGVQGVQGFLSNFQGTQGNQGSQGLQGNQGTQGLQGSIGSQGTQGFQGIQGNQGTQGLQGSIGSQGTQGFQGIQGNQGLQGNFGNQGVQGAQGSQGVQGPNGSFGAKGDQGVQGLQGLQGTSVQGSQGAQGVLSNFQGTQGNQGIQGSQGMQGAQGVQGFLSNFQGTQGNQGLQGNQGIQGVQGFLSNFQGTQGIQGSQGSQATQGVQGAQGSIGPQGFQGLQSSQGMQGNIGNQGGQGLQGLQGTQGFSGSTGSKGDQGAQGLQGLQGSQGNQGLSNQGPQGPQGSQGSQGLQGSQGTQGFTGGEGRQGAQGPQGVQGLSGGEGRQGAQGPQGVQGVQGLQGFSGNVGSKGDQGAQGVGAQGTQGLQGFSGSIGGKGDQGAQGIQGVQGLTGISPLTSASLAVIDAAVSSTINLGSGARLSTVASVSAMATRTEVPGSTSIVVFDGNGNRSATTAGKYYLSAVSKLFYWVNRGGGGWGDDPAGTTVELQFSYDGSTGWTALDQVTTSIVSSNNTWIQREIILSNFSGSQYYNGVYLRFVQSPLSRSSNVDTWAFTSVIYQAGSAGGGGSTSTGSNSLAVMDVSSTSTISLPSYPSTSGVRLTTVSGVTGMTSRTEVPGSTPIVVFDGNGIANSTRTVTLPNRVYLSTVNKLYYWVIKGGGGWGDEPFDTLSLQYSYDGTNWLGTIDSTAYQDILSTNTWTQKSVTVPAAAKYYNGVYLRFSQPGYNTSSTYRSWAITSIIPDFGAAGGGSSGGSTSLALVDLSSSNNFDFPTPQPGARLTTVSAVTGMATRTEVPGSTPIVVFDGNGFYGSTRTATIKNKVFLANVDKVYYWVIKGGGGWGDEPFDTLSLQYSIDGTAWSATIDSTNYSDILSTNSWTLKSVTVPAGAKYYNGVYLRFSQPGYNTSSVYRSWAFTSVLFDLNSISSSGSGKSTSFALMDLSSSSNIIFPTPQPGTRLTTVGSVTGMATRTEVPSSTPIVVFDGNGFYGSTRWVSIPNKVFLGGMSRLYYWVNRGGGGWGDTPYDTLSLQYSIDGTTWSATIDSISQTTSYDGTSEISSNQWTLREVDIPQGAKYYNGVYLRFSQSTYNTSNVYYTWAVTSIVATINEYDQSYTPSTLSLIDLLNQDTFNLTKPRTAARITTVSGVAGMATRTEVPSSTPIVVFGEADLYPGFYGSSRTLTNRSKIFLSNVNQVQFYVNKGGSNGAQTWGDEPFSSLFLQYSADGITWSTLYEVVRTTVSPNTWTLQTVTVPAGAKYYNGVFLRFSQQSYNASSSYYTWAATSVVALPSSGTSGTISYSDDTTTNSTYYPSVISATSGGSLRISSTKLTYNPSTGRLSSSSVSDSKGDLRTIPVNVKSTGYTLVLSDAGKIISTSSGITIPTNVFSSGDAISVFNNSASTQTITASSVTMYFPGYSSAFGSITLDARGVCTILCVSSNVFVISGAGLIP
jgi:hypothetical protein